MAFSTTHHTGGSTRDVRESLDRDLRRLSLSGDSRALINGKLNAVERKAEEVANDLWGSNGNQKTIEEARAAARRFGVYDERIIQEINGAASIEEAREISKALYDINGSDARVETARYHEQVRTSAKHVYEIAYQEGILYFERDSNGAIKRDAQNNPIIHFSSSPQEARANKPNPSDPPPPFEEGIHDALVQNRDKVRPFVNRAKGGGHVRSYQIKNPILRRNVRSWERFTGGLRSVSTKSDEVLGRIAEIKNGADWKSVTLAGTGTVSLTRDAGLSREHAQANKQIRATRGASLEADRQRRIAQGRLVNRYRADPYSVRRSLAANRRPELIRSIDEKYRNSARYNRTVFGSNYQTRTTSRSPYVLSQPRNNYGIQQQRFYSNSPSRIGGMKRDQRSDFIKSIDEKYKGSERYQRTVFGSNYTVRTRPGVGPPRNDLALAEQAAKNLQEQGVRAFLDDPEEALEALRTYKRLQPKGYNPATRGYDRRSDYVANTADAMGVTKEEINSNPNLEEKAGVYMLGEYFKQENKDSQLADLVSWAQWQSREGRLVFSADELESLADKDIDHIDGPSPKERNEELRNDYKVKDIARSIDLRLRTGGIRSATSFLAEQRSMRRLPENRFEEVEKNALSVEKVSRVLAMRYSDRRTFEPKALYDELDALSLEQVHSIRDYVEKGAKQNPRYSHLAEAINSYAVRRNGARRATEALISAYESAEEGKKIDAARELPLADFGDKTLGEFDRNGLHLLLLELSWNNRSNPEVSDALFALIQKSQGNN